MTQTDGKTKARIILRDAAGEAATAATATAAARRAIRPDPPRGQDEKAAKRGRKSKAGGNSAEPKLYTAGATTAQTDKPPSTYPLRLLGLYGLG